MIRRIGLVAFDVDGVLVPVKSSWEYLHIAFGTHQVSRKYLELFREKKISYYEWMFLDTMEWIARFNGKLSKSSIESELGKLSFNEEFKVVFDYLKHEKIKTALVSGGLNILVEKVANFFGADYWFSNILLFDESNHLVPGGIPVVPADKKGVVIKLLGQSLGLSKENIAYVGDSLWDESAFKEAGLSILYGDKYEYPACFHAKTPREVLEAIKLYHNGILHCNE